MCDCTNYSRWERRLSRGRLGRVCFKIFGVAWGTRARLAPSGRDQVNVAWSEPGMLSRRRAVQKTDRRPCLARTPASAPFYSLVVRAWHRSAQHPTADHQKIETHPIGAKLLPGRGQEKRVRRTHGGPSLEGYGSGELTACPSLENSRLGECPADGRNKFRLQRPPDSVAHFHPSMAHHRCMGNFLEGISPRRS